MRSQRQVVDYALAKRAAVAALYRSGLFTTDVCDADPLLLRAAERHGEPVDEPCPICRKPPLTLLTYVFGDELGIYSGRIKRSRELEPMALEYSAFDVHVVEVCRACGWNHLRLSFVLGEGEPPPAAPSRRRRERLVP
jgi:hypothetical protein